MIFTVSFRRIRSRIVFHLGPAGALWVWVDASSAVEVQIVDARDRALSRTCRLRPTDNAPMSIQTDDFEAPSRRLVSAAPASPNEEAIERALRPKGLAE